MALKSYRTIASAVALILTLGPPASADGTSVTKPQDHMMDMQMMGTGLFLPEMNAAAGRSLFASKGCVVCHSINDVGGKDAPALDASLMPVPMNPFEFAAKMWRGAGAMVAMQQDELGAQIELNGQELANIIAFVHDADEQAKFSKADIPDDIAKMMENMP
jgi:mono/diheme cytochrome c family protein